MPRSFEVSVCSPASVGDVLGAFGDEGYWLARIAAAGTSTSLDDLIVDQDGAVTVVTTQDLRNDALPRLLAAFYPSDLEIRGTETWTPCGEVVRGDITMSVTGAPGAGYGEGLLTRSGAGSRLALTGTVLFKVPLVGGKIESFLARALTKQIQEIQHFTTAWITGRA